MVSPNSTYRFMDIKFVENLARAYMRIANKIETQCHRGSCGLMDKAPDFGSGDCRFESCHDRVILGGGQQVLYTCKSKMIFAFFLQLQNS